MKISRDAGSIPAASTFQLCRKEMSVKRLDIAILVWLAGVATGRQAREFAFARDPSGVVPRLAAGWPQRLLPR